MKYVKMLGLLAIAAAALMAFVGTASATVTSPAGTAYTGTIHSSSTNTSLDGTIDVKCANSTVSGSVSNGATTAAIGTLTFTECGNDTVEVTNNGSLKIEGGTLYSENALVTVQVHRSVFGFPITTHCEYATPGAGLDIGSLSGTNTIELNGADIPRNTTDSGCGTTAEWTGTYTINTPAAGITSD